MRYYYTFLAVLFFNFTYAQKQFDADKVERILLSTPKQTSRIHPDTNIIRAIEAVDKHYRIIVDTLYSFKSLKHTIFQSVDMYINDSITFNPFHFSNSIKTSSILFNYKHLNAKVDSIRKTLSKNEQVKLNAYLKNNFESFYKQKLNPQPVRIKYMNFPNDRMIEVGIDIYGNHYLWTIDRKKNWDVVSVALLGTY